MELLIATMLANWIGQAAGWWGPWFSSKGSGSGGGGRTGGSPGTRTNGPSRGAGGMKKIGSWFGNASGWHDARTDAKTIHGRDDPPVTWGQAWREGLESGKARGRERFEAGQQRKAEKVAERDAQQAWLEQAQARGPKDELAPRGLNAWIDQRVERSRTCPDCGHGNRWNDSRVSCPCPNEKCACGDPDAMIGPDDEDDHPDLSKPIDDEQRWGPPEDADADPLDEVAEKRLEREPDSLAAPGDDEEFRPFADGDQVEDLGSGRRGRVRVRESDPEDIAEGAPPGRATVLWDPHPDSPNLTVEDEIDDADRGHLLLLPPNPDSPPTGDGDTPNEENDMSAPAAPMPGMTGEFVNYDSARTALSTASTKLMSMSERQTELAQEAADVVAMCDAMMAGLQAVDSDPEDVGDFMALREQAQQNLDAATKAQTETAEASAYCGTVTENINKRHAAVEEAMRAAKHVAKREAYIAS